MSEDSKIPEDALDPKFVKETFEKIREKLKVIEEQPPYAGPFDGSCEYCTDPDGVHCFPVYGVGPHKCFYTIEGAQIGESVPLPKEEWPDNYQEDPECPGLGTYWCPYCGSGKPNPKEVIDVDIKS